MTRRAKFMWMRDVLEHLNQCCEQWEEADGETDPYLAESLMRDLDEIRRIVESVQTPCGGRADHRHVGPRAAVMV